MHTFEDKIRQLWQVDINAESILRIKERSEGDWNLGDIDGAFTKSKELPEFWELLWYIVEPQAMRRGIGPETFSERVAHREGLVLYQARQAFWLAWADFLKPYRHDKARMLIRAVKWQSAGLKTVQTRLAKQRMQHGRK